jgi:hypothetical protein
MTATTALVLLLATTADPNQPCGSFGRPVAEVTTNADERKAELTEKLERWMKYALNGEGWSGKTDEPVCTLKILVAETADRNEGSTAMYVHLAYSKGAVELVLLNRLGVFTGKPDYRDAQMRDMVEEFVSFASYAVGSNKAGTLPPRPPGK